MPLTLRPPRPGKTSNWEIRGTYRGVRVEESSGTHKRSVALDQLRTIEDCIDQHGQYPAPEAKPDSWQPTFIEAAVAYMNDGGSRRYVARLIKHFGPAMLLSEMTQEKVDAAALALGPNVTPATRAQYVYMPISAIMHHALGDACPRIKKPAGYKGVEKKEFMWPDDANAIIAAADAIDAEFGLYLRFLIYTGIRKGEGLNLLAADTRPEERAAWLRTSKNEDPRMVRLQADLIAPLFEHLKNHPEERLFRFKDGGHFKHLLLRAKLAACGLPCPKRRPTKWKPPAHRLSFVGFHTFRHTWATWMRRYGGADLQGLVETKNWRDPRSAQRYAHVLEREEWDRVDKLPSLGKIRGTGTS